MKLNVCLMCLVLTTAVAHAQLNVELLSSRDYEDILNDIWGYVDENGTEYALVGMTSGVAIVSLEDPARPEEVQFINGVSSIWRDLKTWGDFAYVTADQGQQGLLIIDLSPLPQDTATYAFWRPIIPDIGFYNRAHNIWIDEFGLAYLAGANIGGTVILDLKDDPWNPTFLKVMPLNYAHDVYARDSMVFTSEIYLGQMRIYDISDIDSIRLLGFVSTPNTFTHNAWLSDNGNYAFTTDERSNAFIGSFDISDPSDIREVDRFRPAATIGLGVIPHNVHVANDFLVISYYTDGCIIVDASRPDNLIEVGNYDTYPGPHGGYNGAWGAYPFLPSGNILMSDRQNGLFVLKPEYKRGCYLEGIVKDADSQLPIFNAQIEILDGDSSEVLLPEFSDPGGVFKTGKAVSGAYDVRVSHPDYIEEKIEGVLFENGEVTELNIDLTRRPRFSVMGRVVTMESLVAPVPFAFVALQGDGRLYQAQADSEGQFTIPDVLAGGYDIYAGTWGKFSVGVIEVDGPVEDEVLVNTGYYDDFLNDLGWTVSGTSQGAHWERGEPVLELIFGQLPCNPGIDVDGDFGSSAFVTGNAGGPADQDDVEDGYTLLSSPVMDFTSMQAPVLSFTPWLCVQLIEYPAYSVLLSNGTDTVSLDTVTTFNLGGFWQTEREINLAGVMAFTDQMQVHFLVEDIAEVDNVVKAAVDKVLVYDAMPSAVEDMVSGPGKLSLFPNPSNGTFSITIPSGKRPDRAVIYNVFGQKVYEKYYDTNGISIDVSMEVGPGVYVVQLIGGHEVIGVGKIILE